jgi:ribosomal-protein-alanine N-acetyltransferase
VSGRGARRDFRLRDLRRSDREAMHRLDRRCFEPGIAFTQGQIDSFLELESLEGIVAEARAALIGFAIGYLRRPALGGVLTLDVDPDWRRSGVGRALFEELLSRLEQAGAETVRLEVDVRNEGAMAFYRSFGFRRIGRIPEYYGDGRDAFEMERGASSDARPPDRRAAARTRGRRRAAPSPRG